MTEPTKNQAIRNSKNPEQPFFTKEQLEHLHSFISQTQISSNPTSSSNLAQAGNFLISMHTPNCPWGLA